MGSADQSHGHYGKVRASAASAWGSGCFHWDVSCVPLTQDFLINWPERCPECVGELPSEFLTRYFCCHSNRMGLVFLVSAYTDFLRTAPGTQEGGQARWQYLICYAALMLGSSWQSPNKPGSPVQYAALEWRPSTRSHLQQAPRLVWTA